MPQYFFHFTPGNGARDVVEIELDADQLEAEAIETAGISIREFGAEFWEKPQWSLSVVDTDGETLITLEVTGRRRR